MKRFARWLIFSAVLSVTVLLLAGTWRDPWLWAYLGVFSLAMLTGLMSIDEDLARERYSPSSPSADRVALRAIRAVGAAHLVVGVVDTGRLHWTPIAEPLRLFGLVGFAVSFALIIGAMASNRFFSAVIRLQTDRGHHVVDRGPYGIVRHPGYAGMILAIPCSGLALGSWMSVGLALVYSALIVRRVLFEDGFLRANLVGYSEYASRVRYRLVPGAW